MGEYLLACVRKKHVEEKSWWVDNSIDDEKRDVHYTLEIELLPDSEQPLGMAGYKLDTVVWSRVEYRIMDDRDTGGPPGIFFDLKANDIIKILTIPANCEQVMMQVMPPGFSLPGGYNNFRFLRV